MFFSSSTTSTCAAAPATIRARYPAAARGIAGRGDRSGTRPGSARAQSTTRELLASGAVALLPGGK
jgi:hypothetical protein